MRGRRLSSSRVSLSRARLAGSGSTVTVAPEPLGLGSDRTVGEQDHVQSCTGKVFAGPTNRSEQYALGPANFPDRVQNGDSHGMRVVGCRLSVVSGNESGDEWGVGRVWRRGGRGHQLSGTKEMWLAGPQRPATGIEKSEKRGVHAARNGPSEDRKCWHRAPSWVSMV